MRIINAFECSVLNIGYQGENIRTRVVFDLTEWIEEFGDGTAVLLVARPFETDASPVLTGRDGNIVYWDVTESDLAIKGDGECQLAFTPDGDVIAKTRIWDTVIDRSLDETENPPAPWAGWVADVISAAQAAVEAEEKVPETVQAALAEAKASGEFDGTGIESITQNQDYTLTIHLTDGTEYTTSPVKGKTGDKGDTGNGISGISLNGDYTLTITMTDGSQYTTPSIRGETGKKGDTGAVPAFEIGTVQTLPPDTPASASITGTQENPILNLGIPEGKKGTKGDTGNGISSVVLNADYTLTINFTDGTHTTTDSIRGAQGETGATPAISIGTVETLAPGASATASMSGTAENPVLNLGIPQGQPGDVSKAQLDTKAPVLIAGVNGGTEDAPYTTAFQDGADGMPFRSLLAELPPVQSGSGDPSPENVRPFVLYDGMTVYLSGKNLLQNVGQSGSSGGITWTMNDDGSVTLYGTATETVYAIAFNPGSALNRQTIGRGPMRLVCSVLAGYNPQKTGVIFQADIYIDGVYVRTLSTGTPMYYFGEGVVSIGGARLKIDSGTFIYGGAPLRFYPQVEINSLPTSYEKCDKHEYPVSWVNEAGEICGGKVDVVKGKIYEEWGLFTFPTKANQYSIFTDNVLPTRKYAQVSHGLPGKSDTEQVCVLSETGRGIKRTTADRATSVAWDVDGISTYAIEIVVPADATAASVAATLGGTHAMVLLATPREYDFTPVEIPTRFGLNNIWTRLGNVAVEAPLDTKSYIDRLTQPDNDMVADDNIQANKYFSVNNRLYLSTAAIARGAAIVPGVNCNETSIPEALNALNQ